jgi:hypothetical protein
VIGRNRKIEGAYMAKKMSAKHPDVRWFESRSVNTKGAEPVPWPNKHKTHAQIAIEKMWESLRARLLAECPYDPDVLDGMAEFQYEQVNGVETIFTFELRAESSASASGDRGKPNRSCISLSTPTMQAEEKDVRGFVVMCMEWQDDGGLCTWWLAGNDDQDRYVDEVLAAGAFVAAVRMMDRDESGPKGRRQMS